MKKFILTTFALTLFSTASVFGASHNANNSMLHFLTINGKPLISYNQNIGNNTSGNNGCTNSTKPGCNQTCPQKPQYPSNSTTENTTKVTTEATTETTTQNVTNKDETTQNNSISSMEREVVRLVNVERQKAGLQPLKIDESLCKVARLKSEDMKNKGYFSHTSPTYGSPFDMLKQFNITYKTAGENIAKGQKDAQAVVNAWMNSEGHRKNILSKSFTHIGVGNVKGSTNYWTQLFIAK